MKKTERIITALVIIALGVLAIVLRGRLVHILTTVLGVVLIALGIVDFLQRRVPPAVIKLIFGIVILICGFALLEIVLYVLAALLLIAGILLFYEKWKTQSCCRFMDWKDVLFSFATPIALVLIGVLLLFNQGSTIDWIFVVCGILTIADGGILLADALLRD